jgi:hypothetical protein
MIVKEILDYPEMRKSTNVDMQDTTKIEGKECCLSCGVKFYSVIVCGKKIVGRWCSIECRNAWSAENITAKL